jgi:hypothetical protein
MKWIVFGLASLLLAAAPTTTVELPQSLRTYTSWQRITPFGYSIPGHFARLCVAPAHEGEVIEDTDYYSGLWGIEPGNVPVRVFANPVAQTSVFTKDKFPEGSILVKEKLQRVDNKLTVHQGVMIKSKKGWEFSYYPYVEGATFEACARCHNTAQHDSVFTPYLKK